MNNLNNRRLVTLDSVAEHGDNNPQNPEIPRATVLFGQINAARTAMRNLGGSQIEGFGDVRSAVSESAILRDELLGEMRAINKIARALPVADFPGVRQQFRMPRGNSFQAVADYARSFIANATPQAAIFVDRGRPATFVDDLESALTAFEESRLRRQNGRLGHVGSTAGLEIAARKGIAAMRELDAILSPIYAPNAVLFASWKAAIRIERDAETTPATPTPTAPAPAPAPGT